MSMKSAKGMIKRGVVSTAVLSLMCAFPVFRQAALSQGISQLKNIQTIHIGDLGREEGADLVREKIRLALMKSDRFQVVEKAEEADAILTGVAGVERRQHSSVTTDPATGNVSGSGNTSFAGLGILRLVETKSEETIWIFEYKRGFGFGSASSRVANKTVEKLLKDVKAADRQNADAKPK